MAAGAVFGNFLIFRRETAEGSQICTVRLPRVGHETKAQRRLSAHLATEETGHQVLGCLGPSKGPSNAGSAVSIGGVGYDVMRDRPNGFAADPKRVQLLQGVTGASWGKIDSLPLLTFLLHAQTPRHPDTQTPRHPDTQTPIHYATVPLPEASRYSNEISTKVYKTLPRKRGLRSFK
jgi:hypothetical protein